MLPGMELMSCPSLAVPNDVMQHVVRVESSYNPYAIGVVGGRLARQPRSLPEALATVRMLEERGFNFSVGLAQVNRHNLARYGLESYERAFEACPNLQAGSRILAECHGRSGGNWGKSFSCYYSGNFTTGFRHGYVQKIFASMQGAGDAAGQVPPIDVIAGAPRKTVQKTPVARIGSQSPPQRIQPVTQETTAPVRVQPFAGGPPHQAQVTAQPLAPNAGTAIATQVSAPEALPVPGDHAFVF